MEEEGVFLNSFYEANITMRPEAEKCITRRKLYTYMPHEHRCKNPPKISK